MIKDIPDFEGRYAVTTDGRVYSYRKKGFLKAGRMPAGHYSVALGRGNSKCVHDIVLSTYICKKPPKFECRHLNGDPADNRLSNLVWGRRGDNIRDNKWHGKPRVATVKQAREIRRLLYTTDTPMTEIAKLVGVKKHIVHNIKYRGVHKDVNY